MFAEMRGDRANAALHFLAAGHMELVLAADYDSAGDKDLALRSRLSAGSCFWTLVHLKLAARRYQDFADVVCLIGANSLDESFAQRLHKSVRGDFIECLEEKRREDEYEARKSPYD